MGGRVGGWAGGRTYLLVLSGQVALESAGATPMSFCGARTDAVDGTGSELLSPNGDYSMTAAQIRRAAAFAGLSVRDWVALSGRPRSAEQMGRLGYIGQTWPDSATSLSNVYYDVLLGSAWSSVTAPNNATQYQAQGTDIYMTSSDLALVWDPEMKGIAVEYAQSNDQFLADFGAAWNKIVTADRFDGPTGNLCAAPAPGGGSDDGLSKAAAVGVSVAVTAAVMAAGFFAWLKFLAPKKSALLKNAGPGISMS